MAKRNIVTGSGSPRDVPRVFGSVEYPRPSPVSSTYRVKAVAAKPRGKKPPRN